MLLWLRSFGHLLFPRLCVVCGDALQEGEEGICTQCLLDMPRTNFHLIPNNVVEQMYYGKFPIERASAFFYYRRGDSYNNIVHQVKYRGKTKLGELMGRIMAEELSETNFFRGMDVIVPIPLHPKRLKERGYNQSEYLARGISAVTGICIDSSSVIRAKHTESQTLKAAFLRRENVDGIFHLTNPDSFIGKHVLIVDDVLTTGSTTTACADAFADVKGIRISILTLSKAEW